MRQKALRGVLHSALISAEKFAFVRSHFEHIQGRLTEQELEQLFNTEHRT